MKLWGKLTEEGGIYICYRDPISQCASYTKLHQSYAVVEKERHPTHFQLIQDLGLGEGNHVAMKDLPSGFQRLLVVQESDSPDIIGSAYRSARIHGITPPEAGQMSAPGLIALPEKTIMPLVHWHYGWTATDQHLQTLRDHPNVLTINFVEAQLDSRYYERVLPKPKHGPVKSTSFDYGASIGDIAYNSVKQTDHILVPETKLPKPEELPEWLTPVLAQGMASYLALLADKNSVHNLDTGSIRESMKVYSGEKAATTHSILETNPVYSYAFMCSGKGSLMDRRKEAFRAAQPDFAPYFDLLDAAQKNIALQKG